MQGYRYNVKRQKGRERRETGMLRNDNKQGGENKNEKVMTIEM